MKVHSAIAHLLENCQERHCAAKRIFDIFFSLLVLLISLPLFAVIICAIKIASPGKAIFMHDRIGRGGKSFRCLKFRTMHTDAHERLQLLLASDAEKRREWKQCRKLKNDPRIIPFIGNFLRKSSLDEFPQFWNVLKGDLSVVGPRPVVADEVAQHYGCKASKILSVRPGLTCLWQVSGRSDTDYTTRIGLDEQYVDTRCLRKDLLLIVKTVPCMLFSRGAY